ncbi:hypothetical protein FACS1894126_6350 [Alphaproteobacteria bacterium]|nr:hypothetical protein FACS1894126_6350 [Alphaproteobacteria bacterium]
MKKILLTGLLAVLVAEHCDASSNRFDRNPSGHSKRPTGQQLLDNPPKQMEIQVGGKRWLVTPDLKHELELYHAGLFAEIQTSKEENAILTERLNTVHALSDTASRKNEELSVACTKLQDRCDTADTQNAALAKAVADAEVVIRELKSKLDSAAATNIQLQKDLDNMGSKMRKDMRQARPAENASPVRIITLAGGRRGRVIGYCQTQLSIFLHWKP